MKTTLSIIGIVVLGFFLLTAAGISPALGESNKSFGAEDWVVASSIPPSFATEDWVGPTETPSFGTEDWVLASEAITFGAEDWVPGMELSDAVATGTLPEPAR